MTNSLATLKNHLENTFVKTTENANQRLLSQNLLL